MASKSCCLSLNKFGGLCDPVGLNFWVWPYLCGDTASLKFRQFNSAVCDAFGVFFVLGCLWGVWFYFVSVGLLG